MTLFTKLEVHNILQCHHWSTSHGHG